MASIHQTITSQSQVTSSVNSPDVTQNECLTEFIRTGRTGRRNAVSDVLIDPNISVTTSSITELMFKFDCKDKTKNDT
jgi:hypothetical protein